MRDTVNPDQLFRREGLHTKLCVDRVIPGLAPKQMRQRHLSSGLAGLFFDLVPMIEYLAQDLIGQCRWCRL
jgi:hypothetical protein